MIEQMEALDWSSVLNPFLNIIILIFFIGLMLVCFFKFRVFLVILTIFLFSIIIGVMSIAISEIPFTPYLQIFFILFQGIIFLKFSLEVYL